MKVVLDTYGWPGDEWQDVISVRLDDGTEVYAATIVGDPERERTELEQALRRLVDAEVEHYASLALEMEGRLHDAQSACGEQCGLDSHDGKGCAPCAVHGLCHLCVEEDHLARIAELEHALAEREARIEWWQRRWDARTKAP